MEDGLNNIDQSDKTFRRFLNLLEKVKNFCDQFENEFDDALNAYENGDFIQCNNLLDLIEEHSKRVA
jgi:hypothetical protein